MFDKKDFKYIAKRVIIGLTIAFILFNINKCNAKALVYKGTEFTAFESGESFSGSMSNGSKTLTSTFTTPINTNGYDWLVIPFYEFNFSTTELINGQIIANSVYCKTYTINSAYSSQSGDFEYYPTSMTCSSTASTGSSSSSLSESSGEITLTAQVFNTSNSANLCYFNQNEKQIYCQTNGLGNIKTLKIYINARGYNSINYNIEYYRLKHKYNNDSTEIVNALNGVQTQQQNTTTAINDTLDTINNSNTTGASSSSNTALSGFNSSITTGINDSVGATSLYTLLTNFTNQLSDSTCQPIVIPIPYTNENLTLPCLGTEFANRIPLLWNVYQLIILGAFALAMWQNATEFVFKVMDPYYAGANNLPIGGGK